MRSSAANTVLEILGSTYRVTPHEEMGRGMEEILNAIPGYIQREIAKALAEAQAHDLRPVPPTQLRNIENMNG